jgi:Cu/Ag efflux pump CusA
VPNNDVLPLDLSRNHTQARAKKADVRMEQVTDLLLLSIEPNLKALCRYGLNIADVQIWCGLR